MKKILLLLAIVISTQSFSQLPFLTVASWDYTNGCDFVACDPIGKSIDQVTWDDCMKYDYVKYKSYCYSDTLVYNSFPIIIDTICDCRIHKIYFFINDTCIKYICNYLAPITKNCYRLDKQEISTAPPKLLAKREEEKEKQSGFFLNSIT